MSSTKNSVITSVLSPDESISDNWPLLLKNFYRLPVKSTKFTPVPCGSAPYARPLNEYLKYGVINLDKPPNPSSHEVVSWIKDILNCERTGHSGTLDPKVTGNLIVTLNRSTRLSKSQSNAGKEYVAIIRTFQPTTFEKLDAALKALTGPNYQRPPDISAVKKVLRVRHIYATRLFEYDPEKNLGVFWVSCEAGTYIRVLCQHLGFHIGCGGEMAELRRVRSGDLGPKDSMVTMHEVKDAQWLYQTQKNESYLRSVVQPLEILLVNMKRIFIKDSAIASVCHGAQLTMTGVLRFDPDITVGSKVVLVSTKGEGVALAHARMSSKTITMVDHGMVSITYRVIMERSLYPKQWGYGEFATRKKALMKEGKLGAFGQVTEATPSSYKDHVDNVPVETSDSLSKSTTKSTTKPSPKSMKMSSSDDDDSSESDSASDSASDSPPPPKKRQSRKKIVKSSSSSSSSDDSSDSD